jgi:hypothetical protein
LSISSTRNNRLIFLNSLTGNGGHARRTPLKP